MKNRITATLIVITSAFLITGCSTTGETQVQGQLKCIAGNYTCSEWVDTATGVHYYYTYNGGLELRVNADGTPYTD